MQICPGCGEENPEKFRLCGFCGTPLAVAAPPREVRKTVTIVFSDLKGSTSMGERLDSESLREVMTRYFEVMSAVLVRHGGRVEKYIGDAIMAVFGLPRLHEDDALRAVRAAAEMRDALRALNDELESGYGVRLANRTGVNTGEVVTGDPSAQQRLVIGDPVNVAARLEQAAPALEVLIGEPTYRLVRSAVEVEPVEPLALKGKEEPVPAYRLISVREGEAVPRRHDAPLLGRTAELGVLEDVYREAVEQSACRLVAVLGDAGLGKTRLATEFGRRVAADARVLRGRCLPYGQGITFWPLVEAVREAAGILDGDSRQAARTKLDRLVEDQAAADRLAVAVGLSVEQFPIEELFWGVRKLAEGLARAQPLVVVFDDLHWAEETFLDLVEHLVEAVHGVPLVLLVNARHDLLEQRPSFGAEPPSRRVALGRLTEEHASAVIDAILGGAGIDELARRRIVEAADGNALFLEQLLSMTVDEGLLRLEDGVWRPTTDISTLAAPPTIQALMAARLDGLSTDERTILEAASVAGQVFPLDALEELVAEELRERLGVHLETLKRKRLVEVDPTATGEDERYRFGHITIRDAAYGGLLKRARATLHERFVDWADRTSSGRDVEFEEIRGYHLEQAYRYLSELGPLDPHGIELGARASQRLGSAARRAFSRGDMPAAAGLFRRATVLVPDLSPIRLELLPDFGEALMDLGEFTEAQGALDEAIDAAALIGDARLLEEARLVRLLVERQTLEPENWGESVMREVERARPVFESDSSHAELARMWRLVGLVHGLAYRTGEAAAAAARAIEHARLADDARQEARAATTYATAVLYGPTPVDEAVDQCERIVGGLADRQAEGLVRCALGQLEAMRGEISRARDLYRQGRLLLEEIGGSVVAASTSVDSAAVEMLAGAPETAEADLRRDYATLERLGEKYILPTVAAMLAHAVCAQGRYEEALALSISAEELSSEDDVDAQTLWRSSRAKALARLGDAGAAETLAREAVALIASSDALVQQADALADLSEVLRLAGRAGEASETLEEAVSLYERKGAVAAARSRTELSASTG
jgi:class 3 adenylate cyclase/tetratricopeptide (TPR) repeat protein